MGDGFFIIGINCNKVLCGKSFNHACSAVESQVVQIYVQDPVMDYVRPWKRLVAFQRVAVTAGQTQTVSIPMTADQLEFYDDDMVLRVVPGWF